jgi:hypothetical protein
MNDLGLTILENDLLDDLVIVGLSLIDLWFAVVQLNEHVVQKPVS